MSPLLHPHSLVCLLLSPSATFQAICLANFSLLIFPQNLDYVIKISTIYCCALQIPQVVPSKIYFLAMKLLSHMRNLLVGHKTFTSSLVSHRKYQLSWWGKDWSEKWPSPQRAARPNQEGKEVRYGGCAGRGRGSSWIESTSFLSTKCKATTTSVLLIREENYAILNATCRDQGPLFIW